MGEIVLARVDARLIHGQVMTNLSKSAGATAIFVVDDASAHDDFMKNVILGAGSRTGLKCRVLKEEGAIRYWCDRRYDDYKVILLTKSIEKMAYLIEGGVPIKSVNLGGVPRRPETTEIIKAVAIDNEEYQLLRHLERSFGIEIYFQSTPSLPKLSLAEAGRIMEKTL
ncbi:PTS system sorbose subfamily IIB component [Coriobacterium glomerans PW2]|uniref:PTS system sorbose subfamily IIB component n=1 Tax=Coriobacterium glomerans (strain ATCC 49209 / DSM 20642 / JCM 10262 / PW2) TaxID=700015 RepID=F2N7I6_CORGP|nr:PTS sugar transporter subunit IIB [Coriobacterium glomerans]AEB06802.1 PTS system sorbose subfamily IIB component [Coriobacterium glomerans PW2]